MIYDVFLEKGADELGVGGHYDPIMRPGVPSEPGVVIKAGGGIAGAVGGASKAVVLIKVGGGYVVAVGGAFRSTLSPPGEELHTAIVKVCVSSQLETMMDTIVANPTTCMSIGSLDTTVNATVDSPDVTLTASPQVSMTLDPRTKATVSITMRPEEPDDCD